MFQLLKGDYNSTARALPGLPKCAPYVELIEEKAPQEEMADPKQVGI